MFDLKKNYKGKDLNKRHNRTLCYLCSFMTFQISKKKQKIFEHQNFKT